MEKKVFPKLRQEKKVKVDIVTSYDIKIYYTGKFQDFTARYILNFYKSCKIPTIEFGNDIWNIICRYVAHYN